MLNWMIIIKLFEYNVLSTKYEKISWLSRFFIWISISIQGNKDIWISLYIWISIAIWISIQGNKDRGSIWSNKERISKDFKFSKRPCLLLQCLRISPLQSLYPLLCFSQTPIVKYFGLLFVCCVLLLFIVFQFITLQKKIKCISYYESMWRKWGLRDALFVDSVRRRIDVQMWASKATTVTSARTIVANVKILNSE